MGSIAIMCSGGDVSGMNPALKRFVEYAHKKSLTPYFIYDGLEGLIDNKIVKVSYQDVAGIMNKGGTKIGSSRSKRFFDPKYRTIAKQNLDSLGIEMMIVLGGDGSFRAMDVFYKEQGIKFCGIPSTIDNDIHGTSYCLGVDTALNIIRQSIDAIRDTASSFRRAFVIETMGRDCGYLALISAVTSGAEVCLIPEIEVSFDKLAKRLAQEKENGRNYLIAIVAEGYGKSSAEVARFFEEELHFEARIVQLGHVQRGGNPTVYDRLMAYRFVTYAIDALCDGSNESVICYNESHFNHKSIDEVVNYKHTIDADLLELALDVNVV